VGGYAGVSGTAVCKGADLQWVGVLVCQGPQCVRVLTYSGWVCCVSGTAVCKGADLQWMEPAAGQPQDAW